MKTCRNGNPLCQIGQIKEPWLRPKTIQIEGCSAWEVINKCRNSSPVIKKCSVMIIGEAPGGSEDEIGIPFVGDAGDNLIGFLEKSCFPLDETYISNSIKCRPPKNRKPSVQELALCRPYLIDEIKFHLPKVIMLLGNTALRLFNLTEGGISRNRGKVYKLKLPDWEEGPEFTVIPSLHPAYFLYRDNPQLRQLVEGDFRLAANLAKGEVPKDTKYLAEYKVCLTVEDVKEAVEICRANGKFSADTESPDIKFMTSPLILLQLSAGIGKTFLIPFHRHDPNGIEWKLRSQFENSERQEITLLLKSLFEDTQVIRSFANAKYDANVINRWLDIDVLVGSYNDIIIMHHLIFEYPPHDLETLADTQFQSGDYSYELREIVGHGKDLLHTYDWIPDEKLWPYAANDAELTYRLEDEWLGPDLRSKPNLWKLYNEESLPLIKALRKAEWVGNRIDLDKVSEMEALYIERKEAALQECLQFTQKKDFSPNSPDQVAKVLRELGYNEQVSNSTKAKGYSVGKDILLDIDHPFAQAVLRYRKFGKLLSTYVNRIREDVDENSRVRYSFNIHGTITGRLSCRLLQQIPKIDREAVKNDEAILRQIFIEDNDYEVVYGDFSQIELFYFAYKSEEEELIRILENKEDIHAYTAAAALTIDVSQVSKTNRDNVGKPLNFGTIFGSEGHNIAKVVYEDPITGKKTLVGKERAVKFVENFRSKYKKIDAFLKRTVNIAKLNNGIYTTDFGREKRAFGLDTYDKHKSKKVEREITNFAIQSPSGAIALRTIILLDKLLDSHNIGLDQIRLMNSVHDSISYGVKKKYVPWFCKAFKTIAERPIEHLGNKSFPIKIGVGKSWQEAESKAE